MGKLDHPPGLNAIARRLRRLDDVQAVAIKEESVVTKYVDHTTGSFSGTSFPGYCAKVRSTHSEFSLITSPFERFTALPPAWTFDHTVPST
jgi:hypothetical protein